MHYLTTSISVSKKEYLNCEDMANHLSKHQIISSITSNISTLPHKEYGCRLVSSTCNKNEIAHIWKILKDKYNFECAHLNIQGKFDGCILNYLSESKCPLKDT